MEHSDDRLRFVGEGDLPADLDRVNWGAYGFSFIWALLYGPKRWLLAITAVIMLPIVVDNVVLQFDSTTVFLTVQRITTTFTALMLPLLAAAYAIRINRSVWTREQQRLRDGIGQPVPLWRYRKSMRFWTRLFVVVLVLNALVLMLMALSGFMPLAALLPGSGLIFAVALFVYDRRLARRRHS